MDYLNWMNSHGKWIIWFLRRHIDKWIISGQNNSDIRSFGYVDYLISMESYHLGVERSISIFIRFVFMYCSLERYLALLLIQLWLDSWNRHNYKSRITITNSQHVDTKNVFKKLTRQGSYWMRWRERRRIQEQDNK